MILYYQRDREPQLYLPEAQPPAERVPGSTALLKALYLATFEATKKWTMPIRNWGQVYGELSIMYEGRLPE